MGKSKERYIVDKDSSDQGYPSFFCDKNGTYYMSYYTGYGQTSIRLLSLRLMEILNNCV